MFLLRIQFAAVVCIALALLIGLSFHGCGISIPEAFKYTLTIQVNGPGTVDPSGGEYNAGTVVYLTAMPDPKCRLASWSQTDDDTSLANTNTVTINADVTVTVQFELIPVQPDLTELTAVKQELEDSAKRLDQVLSSPPHPDAYIEDIIDAVNKVAAIGDEVTELDKRAGQVIDDAVEARLQDPSSSVEPAVDALGEMQYAAQDLVSKIDVFLESGGLGDLAAPEFRRAVEDIRDRVRDAIFSVGFLYYRRYIPIRFVQFVDQLSDALSDEILQHNINVTNEIFKPARIRFYLRESFSVLNSEFTNLYILDSYGNTVDGEYTWPDDIRYSPLIWPLHWPQMASCPNFKMPDGKKEKRFYAQMRAGTYCCREDEVLVYINRGGSNGGQYPWFSRIIGMSEYHMHRPGSDQFRYTFPHEMGHYLGLPHPFPSQVHFEFDYDLARIVNPPAEGQDPIQRIFEPHDSLLNPELNPETNQIASLSLFWDLVFKPGCADTPHMFFNSRAEAAEYEAYLQPIEQWNAQVCSPFDSDCADDTSPFTRVEHMVSAGCQGAYGNYNHCYFGTMAIHCVCPVQALYTGDSRVQAFSDFGSGLGKLRWNLMSYEYKLPDGSDVPSDIFESVFLCESQLEQIERVFTHDIKTKRFFPEQYGLRPKLGLSVIP